MLMIRLWIQYNEHASTMHSSLDALGHMLLWILHAFSSEATQEAFGCLWSTRTQHMPLEAVRSQQGGMCHVFGYGRHDWVTDAPQGR